MIAHIESPDSIGGNPAGSRSLLVSQIGLECPCSRAVAARTHCGMTASDRIESGRFLSGSPLPIQIAIVISLDGQTGHGQP
jgi:hypothetical protein